MSAASTDDVAISVGILSTLSEISHGSPSCEFAIRSGGHSVASGQANIKLGVTLDLSSLDTLEVLEGNTVTSIGPGARWGEVYLYLDSLKLATTGGRVAEVGVGGLTTGGWPHSIQIIRYLTNHSYRRYIILLTSPRLCL